MKRVIRNIRTQEFFSNGIWTRNPALAQDFPDTLEILLTCAEYHLRDVELALQLGCGIPDACDICLPLPAAD